MSTTMRSCVPMPISSISSRAAHLCELDAPAVDLGHFRRCCHLMAATPVGHQVTATAEVTKVDGRRIEFKVSARDETEEIGNGTHQPCGRHGAAR